MVANLTSQWQHSTIHGSFCSLRKRYTVYRLTGPALGRSNNICEFLKSMAFPLWHSLQPRSARHRATFHGITLSPVAPWDQTSTVLSFTRGKKNIIEWFAHRSQLVGFTVHTFTAALRCVYAQENSLVCSFKLNKATSSISVRSCLVCKQRPNSLNKMIT